MDARALGPTEEALVRVLHTYCPEQRARPDPDCNQLIVDFLTTDPVPTYAPIRRCDAAAG